MNITAKNKTALLAVLMLSVVAAGTVAHYHGIHHALGYMVTALTMLAGSTVIQTYPIAGTFPTSAQAFYNNTQINRVVMADADTVAVLTHNWMLSTAQLAAFLPIISFYIENIGATYPPVSFALTDSNTVTMNKTATTGSGGTYVVTMARPLSSTL